MRPIILGEHDLCDSSTIIERFEKVSSKCKYAIAICTPDDIITKQGKNYLQPCPNVIYEIGWFGGKLGRKKVMILVQDGTNIFSDFDGVIQIRFETRIKECYHKVHRALRNNKLV